MKSYFFNAVKTSDTTTHPSGYDREYDADDHAAFFAPFFNEAGVFAGADAGACKVQVQSGLTLVVSAGAVYVRGRMAVFDGTETVTVSQNCKIVARMDKSMAVRDFQLLAVTELTQTEDVYDLELASVTLEAVSGGHEVHVTDTRTFLSYMGQPAYYPPTSDDLPYILWLYTLGFPMSEEQRAAVEGNPSLMSIFEASVGGDYAGHKSDKQNPHEVTAAQVGAYTKEETLSEDTKTLLGLSGTATPDDAFKKLAAIPKGYGRVVLKFQDSEGPVPMVITSLYDNQVGDVKVSDEGGVYSLDLTPGTKTFKITWPIGYSNATSNYSVAVTEGQVTTQTYTGTRSTAERSMTASGFVAVAAHIGAVDIQAVGGGGSGATAVDLSGHSSSTTAANCAASGGAGGKLTLLKNTQAARILYAEIGAGGAGAAVSRETDTGAYSVNGYSNGNAGGATAVKNAITGDSLLTAPGGSGGLYKISYGYSDGYGIKGADGGSGSGAAYVKGASSSGTPTATAGTIGTNGGNGGAASSFSGGTGQGTSTRDWQETSGTLNCHAGGSAAAFLYRYDDGSGNWLAKKASAVSAAVSGAADAKVSIYMSNGSSSNPLTYTLNGTSGTAVGGGGGAAIGIGGQFTIFTVTSGAGKAGGVKIRAAS